METAKKMLILQLQFYRNPGSLKLENYHFDPEFMKIRVRGDRITISGIIDEAKKNGIEYKTIHDAGRTEIEAGSLTVLSLGPEIEEKLENFVLKPHGTPFVHRSYVLKCGFCL